MSLDVEGKVKLWNISDSKPFLEIDKYASQYDTSSSTTSDRTVQFSEDGKSVLLKNNNRYDVINPFSKETIKSQFGRVLFFEENSLTSITTTPELELRDEKGNLISAFKGHETAVVGGDISPNGEIIVSVGEDGNVHLWGRNGTLLKVIDHVEKINDVAFSLNGEFLALASDDMLVSIYDKTGNSVVDNQGNDIKLSGHTSPVTDVLFSPDGKTLASASVDFRGSENEVKLWNINTWKQIGNDSTFPSIRPSEQNDLWFSENGRILAYGAMPVNVWLLDRSLKDRTWVSEVAFYPLSEVPDKAFPDNKDWITVKGSKGTIVLSLGLDHSLQQACSLLGNYIMSNEKRQNSRLCDDNRQLSVD
ncbi:MAG: hypothetical protein AAFR58_21255 [Cyanobacteria bacterium J06627_28]